jgi:hypothetical protein
MRLSGDRRCTEVRTFCSSNVWLLEYERLYEKLAHARRVCCDWVATRRLPVEPTQTDTSKSKALQKHDKGSPSL